MKTERHDSESSFERLNQVGNGKYRRVRPALYLSLAASILFGSLSSAHAESLRRLASPDGRIQVSIQLPDAGSTNTVWWAATFGGRPIVSHGVLGLETTDSGALLAGVRLLHETRSSANRRIPVLFGKTDHADDKFHELSLAFKATRDRPLNVTFRCYNDAVAFRYELPRSDTATTVTIADETTSFRINGDPGVYAQYLENYTTSHEHNVTTTPYRELRSGTLLDLPLTFSWNDGTYAAITEGALRHYAGMSLMRSTNGGSAGDLVCKLTPRPDGTKVVRPLPMQTPWRVVLLGDRPGALLESETLYCLNDPPAFRDVSWIHPGKITFHWWNGDVYDGTPGLPILSFDMAKKYIDFCARTGIPTHSLTSEGQQPTLPWYFQSNPSVAPGPDTDVTRTRADFDLPAIRQYATSQHVKLWTWVHQGALRGRVEEAFTAFEKMGWSGMMVDFFDHDDQESIEFAESMLQSAARHHLLIHFHGVWKPTGWQRTYPNLMNHEGALNLEYLKWSDRCTPEHNLNLAFTRLIAGPMDYHLGGFRAVTRAEFKPHMIAPNVLGTRCHHLAMYVCFDNPNPMLADYPTAYEGQPGFEFLQQVPTWWDDTRVLEGKVGELLVTARRKGKDWYLGGMSARQPRNLELPLSFLGAGKYDVEIWKDADDAKTEPNHLTTEKLQLTAHDKLQLHVVLDGGFVARLKSASR